MDSNEKSVYTGATGSRNNEGTLRWYRNSVFIIIHSSEFSFILIYPPALLFMVILAFVGLVLGGFWIMTNWRSQQWIKFWNNRIDKMERSKENAVLVKIYSSKKFRKVNNSFPTFHQILMSLSAIATAGWLSVFVYALTRLIKGGA